MAWETNSRWRIGLSPLASGRLRHRNWKLAAELPQFDTGMGLVAIVPPRCDRGKINDRAEQQRRKMEMSECPRLTGIWTTSWAKDASGSWSQRQSGGRVFSLVGENSLVGPSDEG